MDLNVITLKSKKTNAKTNLGEVALKGVTDDARHDPVLRTHLSFSRNQKIQHRRFRKLTTAAG